MSDTTGVEEKPSERPAKRRSRKRRVLRWILIVLGVILVLIGLLFAGYVRQNVTYYASGMEDVEKAGFTEKSTRIQGHRTNYAEGPDNGDPFLMIHGQGSQWQDQMKVLPELAKKHHVFAIDVYGHGGSARLPREQYTNARIGDLIAEFVEREIGEPAVVSGHSSGALLATRIAAHRPDLVKGVVLEDPPFFSSIMPRAKKTAGGDLTQITHEFVSQDRKTDFQRFYVERSNYFAFFGGLEKPIVDYSVGYLEDHPGKPLEIFFLPPTVNGFFQGLVHYDPVFGDAWYDNTWYDGFDTEASLSAIKSPVVLIHTDYWKRHNGTYYDERGVLMAAMDDRDLARTKAHLHDVRVVSVDSGHNVHFEKPDVYLDAVRGLVARLR